MISDHTCVQQQFKTQNAIPPALGAQLVHLVQVVLNWYNLVAALAAGGVPFCD
jgi:hypothetical protein